jgi:hypothetical protein
VPPPFIPPLSMCPTHREVPQCPPLHILSEHGRRRATSSPDLAEAPPPRPSSVSTTVGSSLVTFSMSHPSPQPFRAAGPFHYCRQPPHWLAIDEPPLPNREPPPHRRHTIWVSPRPVLFAWCTPQEPPAFSMETRHHSGHFPATARRGPAPGQHTVIALMRRTR